MLKGFKFRKMYSCRYVCRNTTLSEEMYFCLLGNKQSYVHLQWRPPVHSIMSSRLALVRSSITKIGSVMRLASDNYIRGKIVLAIT